MAAVLLLTSGGKDKSSTAATSANKPAPAEPAGDKLTGTLGPVPMNHVTGAGDIAMRLDGTTLTVTVDAPRTGRRQARDAHPRRGARRVPAGVGREAPQRAPGDQHRRRRAVLRAAGHRADDQGRHQPEEHPGLQSLPQRQRRPLHAQDRAHRRRRGEHPQGGRRRHRPRHRLRPRRGVRQRASTAAISTARCPGRSRRRRSAGRSSRPRRHPTSSDPTKTGQVPRTQARAPSTWPRCSRSPPRSRRCATSAPTRREIGTARGTPDGGRRRRGDDRRGGGRGDPPDPFVVARGSARRGPRDPRGRPLGPRGPDDARANPRQQPRAAPSTCT